MFLVVRTDSLPAKEPALPCCARGASLRGCNSRSSESTPQLHMGIFTAAKEVMRNEFAQKG